mgnify:CR=1 FL=1
MNFILKELNLSMGIDVYEMYQDIPAKESGSTNECFGLSYEQFPKYLEKEINRKNNKITYDDTPTTTYIMYVNNIPVGLICLRTEIDDNWKKWSGNFYYRVRLSARNKGYGTKMLELAIDEFRKLGFKEIYGQSSAGNISSAKVIENNSGIFLYEDNGTRYYKIII